MFHYRETEDILKSKRKKYQRDRILSLINCLCNNWSLMNSLINKRSKIKKNIFIKALIDQQRDIERSLFDERKWSALIDIDFYCI